MTKESLLEDLEEKGLRTVCDDTVRQVEHDSILLAAEQCDGKRPDAAKFLKVSLSWLRTKIVELGLQDHYVVRDMRPPDPRRKLVNYD